MGRYDELLIDAPFWADDLIEVDYTPFPQAAVSALAGFAEFGDQIQVIEGLGSLGASSPTECATAAAVAAMVSTLGQAACMAFSSKAAREQCAAVVGTGAGGGGVLVTTAMGCTTSAGVPTVRVDPRAAERERLRILSQQNELRAREESYRREQDSKRNTMMLVGGGIAAASLIAVIALRR